MRQGCISSGEIQCDSCNQTIPYLEQYLTTDELDIGEGKKAESGRYCLRCCLDKGYAHYHEEKNERIPTFFPEAKLE